MRNIEDVIVDGTKDERVFVCGEDFAAFFAYYFSSFFVYETPEFHKDMFDDVQDLSEQKLDELMWCMFRESAKTSIAKVFVCWLICYRKKRFINYDCHDKANAEAALYDIAVWLQTNERIREDFGDLYYEEDQKKKFSTIKRLDEFITSNGVKVKAYSTQQSTRGRIYNRFRPDMYVMDDFETVITKRSIPVTQKIIEHIDEMKSGLGIGGSILYLCNYITESGSVAHVMNKLRNNPMRARIRIIPVEKDGVVAWPSKYTLTEKEAVIRNIKIGDREKRVISLEAKRKSLGDELYETEMKNNPSASAEIVFDRAHIDRLLKDVRKPMRDIAGLKVWADYNPKHRYGIGADTSEGVGRDSNTSAIIDFGVTPAQLVGTFANNMMPPDIFGHELRRQGELYGLPIIGPESNNTGGTTLVVLKSIYPLDKIYRRENKEKVKNQFGDEYGFRTTSATKPMILYNLRSAVHDGELEIYDEDVLNELRAFTLSDLKLIEYKEGMTRHFDRVMALAIAWEMRHHAKPAELKPFVQQSTYKPISRYEGL